MAVHGSVSCHAGLETNMYITGYYIHTCQKMRYKAEYQPSQLLDPVSSQTKDIA